MSPGLCLYKTQSILGQHQFMENAYFTTGHSAISVVIYLVNSIFLSSREWEKERKVGPYFSDCLSPQHCSSNIITHWNSVFATYLCGPECELKVLSKCTDWQALIRACVGRFVWMFVFLKFTKSIPIWNKCVMLR